jgi:hypothetical protein
MRNSCLKAHTNTIKGVLYMNFSEDMCVRCT